MNYKCKELKGESDLSIQNNWRKRFHILPSLEFSWYFAAFLESFQMEIVFFAFSLESTIKSQQKTLVLYVNYLLIMFPVHLRRLNVFLCSPLMLSKKVMSDFLINFPEILNEKRRKVVKSLLLSNFFRINAIGC